MKKILVFNIGSSTLKFSMFEGKTKTLEGKYEKLKKRQDYIKAFIEISNELKNHVGFDLILHRVVHGGEMKSPQLVTKQLKEKIFYYSKFAPLHNLNQLMIIKLSEKFHKPQYVIFDTSFFIKLPSISKIYPIPLELTKKYHLRKFGFHGISHASVSQDLNGKTITIHLGKGASMTAIKNKKPVDTSMGLTPLEGLMMCTRSGTIDPGLILFLEKNGYKTEKILNLQSGLKGISGFSDFRDVLKTKNKNKLSKLAYDMFISHIIEYIGAYSAILDGVDNLVFTGAIGTEVPELREKICNQLDYLGIKLDKNKNKKNKELISSSNSKVKVYVRNPEEDTFMVKMLMKNDQKE